MATTPNMGLTLPEVLVTSGPQYATEINTAFDEVDSHDHSPGKGSRITPSGLNINASLPINNNSITNIKSLVLATQTSVTTNKSIYSRGVDLYYRDNAGNEIQLTAAGGVNVSGVGGFTGLVSPASATYTLLSETFGFFSDASEYAKLATGDLQIFPRTGASPQAVTLIADAATAAYNLLLPTTAPVANSFMRMQTGSAAAFVELLGTNNQVTVTQNTSDMTLSLPQDIHTGATPTFAGLTLTGALTGTSAAFTTAVFSGAVQFQNDLSLTGPSPSLLTASNYTATFGSVKTDLIAPETGTDVTINGNIQSINMTLSQDISARDLTLSGNVTLSGFLKTITGATVDASLRNITATQTLTGSTVASSGPITGASLTVTTSATASVVQTDTILPKTSPITGGIAIYGRRNGSAPAAGDVGETSIYGPSTNITCSASFQNLQTLNLGPGVWEVSGCVGIIGNNAVTIPNVRFLQAAVSLASATTDDSRYARSQAAIIALGLGEQMDVITFSRRINLASNTDVYLVARVIGTNVNQALFEAARTTLKIQRVG